MKHTFEFGDRVVVTNKQGKLKPGTYLAYVPYVRHPHLVALDENDTYAMTYKNCEAMPS